MLPGSLRVQTGAVAESQPWIDIGKEKAAIARHSKSPDGRQALAWTVAEANLADWELLKSDPNSFYEKNEVREIWIVDLLQKRKLCTLGSSIGYVRPGSHRTLNVAWGPLEGGRRFAIITYDSKWGTDALIVLDVGADGCREAQVGATVDRSVSDAVRKQGAKSESFDMKYSVAELAERGRQTGFADASTIRIPFAAKIRGEDRPAAEGIVALRLSRRVDGPSAQVIKTTIGAAADNPFADDARLAKADRELNAVYAELCKRLDRAALEKLKEDERRWIEDREKQTADLSTDSAESSRIARDQKLRQLTEERTAQLRKRLQSLKR
jgi:uncharacterized protein YecT (DUF1311 family)